jgi:hypothetical protein
MILNAVGFRRNGGGKGILPLDPGRFETMMGKA